MSKSEGNLEAPTRHALDWKSADFYSQDSLNKELERVFEPFYRSPERSGGGSGLGLAIARGFVEANGGRLRAQSLPGQGTSFVLSLIHI